MEDLVLKVEHVSKEYRLGTIGGGTLKGEIQSKMAKLRHKEDPNLKIGQKSHEKNERFLALDDVSFEIRKGERIGIIGHNGAGKSTILKLICRVTAPSKGNIYLNGRITSMLEVGTGFHNELTGRENVYLNGSILGMSKAEIDEKFDEIVDFSEVGQFIDTPVKRYSSGMNVKLGFSVASHLNSEIMIMDEVLAVGDMAFQKKCIERMKEVAEVEGRTVLYVSHNMNTIRQLCTRCIVLSHGKVIFDGDVDKAISYYLGSVDENSIEYDFSDIKRDSVKSYKLQLLGLLMNNKEYNSFSRNEQMNLTMKCLANEVVENIRFRLEFFYIDGSIVGSALSDKGISAKKNEHTDVDFKFDLTYFAPGRYYAIALAYEQDLSGNQIDTDRVEPAFYFDVTDESENSLTWLHTYWGHVHFSDIQIQKIEGK